MSQFKKKKKDGTIFYHKHLNLHTSYGEREQGHIYFTLPTGPSTVPAYCYHSLNVKLISAITSSNPTARPPPPSPKPGKQAERRRASIRVTSTVPPLGMCHSCPPTSVVSSPLWLTGLQLVSQSWSVNNGDMRECRTSAVYWYKLE